MSDAYPNRNHDVLGCDDEGNEVMAERYENDIQEVIRMMLECAVSDREGMIMSLMGGYYGSADQIKERMKRDDPETFEYLQETEKLVRDFKRFARNRGIWR